MTNSRKTLYIHIGANKTGSTALQFFLESNRKALSEQGILYPTKGVFCSAHYHISDKLGYGPKLLQEQPDIIDEIKNEINHSAEPKAIISSEYFILSKDPSNVRKAFSEYDVKIILYLRRHDLWFESLYNQAVKTALTPRWDKGIQSFITYQQTHNIQEFDYLKIIKAWCQVFGQENIIVRPYEKSQFKNQSIYDDFLACLGVESRSNYVVPDKNLNTSIPIAFLDIVDSLNRQQSIDNETKKKAINKISSLRPDKKSNKSFNLSPAERIEIINSNQDAYRFIAKTYLSRENEILFLDDLPSVDSDWTPPPKATLAMALGIIAKLCNQ